MSKWARDTAGSRHLVPEANAAGQLPTVAIETTETLTTVADTALNSLANAASATAAIEYVNAAITNGGSCLYADFELYLPTMTAPNAGALIDLLASVSYDGTNYATALKLGSFTIAAVTTQRVALLRISIPAAAKIKFGITNGSGQTFAASNNTLKIKPYMRG